MTVKTIGNVTIVKSQDHEMKSFERHVQIHHDLDLLAWVAEAFMVHKDTKHKFFCGCIVEPSYEDLLYKSKEWVDGVEKAFF